MSYAAPVKITLIGEKPAMQTGPLYVKLETCSKRIKVCQGGGDAAKCLGIDTPVLMYDLSVKNVQDIKKGDKLMGIDGTPRTVLGTTKGIGQLYKIRQKRGIDYVVNDAHILCLKHSGGKEIYKTIKGKKIYQHRIKTPGIHKITAEQYFNSSKKYQKQFTGFKTGFELPEREVLIDPYYLGLWLGDGCSRNSNISNIDPEIIDYLHELAPKYNCIAMQQPFDKNTIRISRPLHTSYKNGKGNLLVKYLNHYNLIKNKHIPFDYLHNSREIRKKLLAGLIDSDGSLTWQGYYSIISTKKNLAEQIQKLANSLGYSSRLSEKIAKMKRKDGSTYSVDCWGVCISCNNGESIPVLVDRKKKVFKNKVCDCLNSAIEIEKLGVGDYYGFTLDGDRMFMLGDFTVTHNTVCILQRIAVKCIQHKGIQATVVGTDIPNLKRGAMRAFKKYVAVNPQVAPFIAFYNKTDREYHFNNGSVITFTSFENDEDARGSENDIVFMNEANLMSYNLFWELQRKCRMEIILDYNPTFAFWAHAKLIHGGESQFHGHVQLYITDHRHNPFLTDDQHLAYENISDPERFKVYARGMTGQLKGMIFNWKRIEKIPKGLPFGFGMDIGYTSDKTALVKIYIDGKNHYYQELLYKSNDEIQQEINQNAMTNAMGYPLTVEEYIYDILVRNGLEPAGLLYGDHDKSMSKKLRRLGAPYRMAKKGPNSVVASISSVKRYNGFYCDSPNLEEEKNKYIWETAVDILTGNEVSTGVPVDGMPDHLIAAIRYFEHSYSMRFPSMGGNEAKAEKEETDDENENLPESTN